MALRKCTRLSYSGLAKRAAVSFCVAMTLTAFAAAQNTNGRVIGIVTDPSGAALAGAKVTVTNTGTNVSWNTATDDKGSYQVLDVPIGMYRVTIESQGFAKVKTEPQELTINQSLRIDVHMKLGGVNEVVDVQSQAAQVETVNPTIGGTVTGKAIQDLPLNGRNTLDLALTQPGVLPIANDIGTYGTNNGGAAETGLGGISVAGGRGDAVGYLLDGGMNNRTTSNQVVFNPNPEAIEEFKLLENNYTAEYGRNGGGMISVVLKSGTNSLHGSVFEFLRNDAMNANDYIDNEIGQPRQVLKRNQFGGVVGGPITMGKWLNGKDRFFFFFGYQGQRLSQTINEANVTGPVPVYTPAELNGNFSQSYQGGPDPFVQCFLTGNKNIVLPLPGSPPPTCGSVGQVAHPYYQSNSALAAQAIIDPTKFDSVAQKYIAAGLIPTSPGGVLFPQGSGTDNANQYVGKFDFYASTNDRIALSLGYNKEPITNPFFGANIPGFVAATTNWDYFANINYTKTISISTLNELLITAQRFRDTSLPTSQHPTPTQLGVIINSDDPFGPPTLSFNSGMTVGFDPNVAWKADNNYAVADNLTWNHGHHTFKFGGRFGIMQENSVYAYQTNGIFYFYGPGSIGSWNDLADFLFGASDEFSEYSKAPSNEHQKQYAAFAQDEWKATTRLTVTYGLRYEYTSPETDTHGYSFSIVPGRQSVKFPGAPLGFLVPGDPGAPRGWYYPDYTNLSPRIGIAWDPFGDGKTSVRGGGGMFFDTLNGWMSDWATDEAPWAGGIDFNLSPSNVPLAGPAATILSDPYGTAGLVDPFPSQEPPPSNINFADAGFTPFLGPGNNFVNIHLKTPYIYQYNLSIERQISNGLMAEVGYVGSSSHKLLTWVDQNPFILSTVNVKGVTPTRILNQQLLASNPSADPNTFGFAPTFDGLNHANYNGLLASLTKRAQDVRYLGNVFFTTSYTWSHNLDSGTGFNSRVTSTPYYNHNQFWGNSDFDLRQRLAFSGGWELPFAKAWADGPKRLTSGWSLFPIYFIQSGIPLDFLAGTHQSSTHPGPSGAGDGEIVRADQVVSSVKTLNPRNPGNYWFDPSSFEQDPCINAVPPATPCPLGFYGTYRRNSLHGPRHSNFDLALEKSTNLVGEQTKLIFRAEAFNIFNHAEFRPPAATSVTDGAFGQIGGTYAPRILQMALKVTF